MAKYPGQKRKLLYLMEILLKETDEDHPLSLGQLIAKLQERGIHAERKSLYDDLETLRVYGVDVIREGAPAAVYYVGQRPFEMAELKLLVDAVQSSRFITAKKSRELIAKVEGLASVHQAKTLQRQVFVANRVKTMNESIYYNIDALHQAVFQERQISFRYFEWVVEPGGGTVARRFRHGGRRYRVSPWALTWDDENYYLVAYDTSEKKIKHFRVDKMEDICLEEEERDGQAYFEKFDMAVYSRQVFGMYGGAEERVRIRFADHLAGVVVDRFGKDILFTREDEGHFSVSVKVAVSPQFLSWIFGFGKEAQILSPRHVADQLKKQLRETLGCYEEAIERQ